MAATIEYAVVNCTADKKESATEEIQKRQTFRSFMTAFLRPAFWTKERVFIAILMGLVIILASALIGVASCQSAPQGTDSPACPTCIRTSKAPVVGSTPTRPVETTTRPVETTTVEPDCGLYVFCPDNFPEGSNVVCKLNPNVTGPITVNITEPIERSVTVNKQTPEFYYDVKAAGQSIKISKPESGEFTCEVVTTMNFAAIYNRPKCYNDAEVMASKWFQSMYISNETCQHVINLGLDNALDQITIAVIDGEPTESNYGANIYLVTGNVRQRVDLTTAEIPKHDIDALVLLTNPMIPNASLLYTATADLNSYMSIRFGK